MVGVGQTQPTTKGQPWMTWVSETRRGAEAEKRNNGTYILVVDRASWPSGLTESGVYAGRPVGIWPERHSSASQNAGAETAIICTCQLRLVPCCPSWPPEA